MTERSDPPAPDSRSELHARADRAQLPAPADRPHLLIGLTGPIGCGKSTVAAMLGELGADVIDADAVARQVTNPGSSALLEIRQRFGDAVCAPDGTLDRAALARIVFADAFALADLERITHPRVREAINGRLALITEEGTPVAAIEAIKLVESGLADHCDEVWLIECDPTVQVERLRARGASDEDISSRVEAQGKRLVDRLVALLEGREVRHRRVSTDGTVEATRERVEDALAEALSR